MPYTEAQKRATMRYQKENLVCLSIRMKPEEKEAIMAAAEAAGMSVKSFILDAVKHRKA